MRPIEQLAAEGQAKPVRRRLAGRVERGVVHLADLRRVGFFFWCGATLFERPGNERVTKDARRATCPRCRDAHRAAGKGTRS